MIQSFFIIAENGICIYERHYSNAVIDAQIFSGFIIALGNFAIDSMGEELQQLKIKGGRLSMVKHAFAPIMAVAIADDKDSGKLLYKILKVVLLEFYDLYYREIKKEDPSIKTKTQNFDNIIDDIIKKRFGIADRTSISIFLGLFISIGLSSLVIIGFAFFLTFLPDDQNIFTVFFGYDISVITADGISEIEFLYIQRIALVVIIILMMFFLAIFFLPVFMGSYYAGSRRNGIMISLGHFGTVFLVVFIVGSIDLIPNYQVQIIPLFISFSPLLITLNLVMGIFGGYIKENRKLWPLGAEELSEKLKKEMYIFLKSMDKNNLSENKKDQMPPNF
ncbi:MAG: hypothetical protein EAX96_14275 [Candidatus Lokiarchaeota archaeon]|nr:hypothetical protein [Candidatus Lokiarchaeota archaeon]